MKMTTSMLNTPLIAAVSELVLFFIIMGLVFWYVLGVVGADSGKVDIKSFGQIKQRALEKSKELIFGITIGILIFSVLKLSGLIVIVHFLGTWFALAIQAFLNWLQNNAPTV